MKKIIFINTPPPTISGNLHLGHLFSYTHIDCVARGEKYLGNNIKFPIGFDCNGIPTENLLRKTNQSIEKIDIYCQDYLNLFKTMGFQMDFDNFYKTIDFDANLIFQQLKNQNLIYEDEKETWFDSALNTPLADCEVIEKDGVMIGEVSKKPVIKQKSTQFFLKTLEFKNELLQLANVIEFYPLKMKSKLTNWIENLNQDWCISRDRNFGIKINSSDKVFDTWFISGLTFNKYNQNSDYHFQSHEIIRSWCFYSLVMAYHLNKNIPFKKVFISGWCIAKDGQKLSKSSGNFIDPSVLIEKYGVNPIRFWAMKANWGTDTYFDENVLLNGRRLETKIINAERFFLLKDKDIYLKQIQAKDEFEISLEFKNLIKKFEYSNALNFLYNEFFKFCDIEIEKCKRQEANIYETFTKFLFFKKAFSIFLNLKKINN